jgi:hypothetical protein
MNRRRVVSALLVLLGMAGFVSLSFPASASSEYYCYDSPVTPGPDNTWDSCVVDGAVNQVYIGEVSEHTNDCLPGSYHKQRIRVVADYQSPDKLRIRSISIRHLDSVRPWAYYQVEVADGAGQQFKRHWNNYGNLIYRDGAGRDVDNVTTLTPDYGFAPAFGPAGRVTIILRPIFFWQPDHTTRGCGGKAVGLELRR